MNLVVMLSLYVNCTSLFVEATNYQPVGTYAKRQQDVFEI